MATKYIRYLGPNDRFVDGDTVWEKNGEPQGVDADKASEFLDLRWADFEEAKKDDGPLYDEAGELTRVDTPEGDVRWEDPETGRRSMVPVPTKRPEAWDEEAAQDDTPSPTTTGAGFVTTTEGGR